MLWKGCGRMKKKIIILLAVVIVVVSALFTYFYKYAGSMVSQDVKNVDSIVIAMYPYDTNKIIVEDKNEINKIFNILLQTTDITNDRHPSHLESMQHDPQFIIDIKYHNGKKDNLFASPRTNYIGRFLNSKGNSGDPGYRIGKNRMIWDYVLN